MAQKRWAKRVQLKQEAVLAPTPALAPLELMAFAAACIRGLREVAEAGAELIQLHPLFDEAEQIERLVGEVLSPVQNN